MIAERLERGRIFEQSLTPSTLKDYCFRNPERALDLLLSLDLDPATAVRIRDGAPPKPRARRATGDLPVVNAPSRKRCLGPRFYDPAISPDAAGRNDGTLAAFCARVCVCVHATVSVRLRRPVPPHLHTLGRRTGN